MLRRASAAVTQPAPAQVMPERCGKAESLSNQMTKVADEAWRQGACGEACVGQSVPWEVDGRGTRPLETCWAPLCDSFGLFFPV